MYGLKKRVLYDNNTRVRRITGRDAGNGGKNYRGYVVMSVLICENPCIWRAVERARSVDDGIVMLAPPTVAKIN